MHKQLQYIVLQHHGEWKVLLDRYHGPYGDRDAAISNAIEAADRARRHSRASQVILRERDKDRLLWSSEQNIIH